MSKDTMSPTEQREYAEGWGAGYHSITVPVGTPTTAAWRQGYGHGACKRIPEPPFGARGRRSTTFRVQIDGNYGDEQTGVYLHDEHGEIACWVNEEWESEPSLVAKIAEAIVTGYEDGPGMLREMFGKVEPPFGEGDRVYSTRDHVGPGTVTGLTGDPRAPFAVAWDDEDVIGGAYAADELESAE